MTGRPQICVQGRQSAEEMRLTVALGALAPLPQQRGRGSDLYPGAHLAAAGAVVAAAAGQAAAVAARALAAAGVEAAAGVGAIQTAAAIAGHLESEVLPGSEASPA